uniref:Uncharacterized protein n=1 Tax=Mus musculus TaxID=10090 RepID=Q3TYW0_MOUSE|nr:unnamed protein product [Mus musculus]
MLSLPHFQLCLINVCLSLSYCFIELFFILFNSVIKTCFFLTVDLSPTACQYSDI